MIPLTVVRIRLDDLAAAWLDAFAALIAAIDDADPVLVTDEILQAAESAKAVLRRGGG